MKVITGTKFNGGRDISVELEDSDAERIFVDWENLTIDKRFKKLSAYADLMVLQYLLQNEAITREVFDERFGEVAKGLK